MNYKETLFFIAKCLTISLEVENRKAIEKYLKSETIDWDAVVKVSTAVLTFTTASQSIVSDFKYFSIAFLFSTSKEIVKHLAIKNKVSL